MLSTRQKKSIIDKLKRHPTDSGSEEVQVGLLTKRIEFLQEHIQKHAKDFSSKRSLVMLVSRRRRLLNYLKNQNEEVYNKIKETLKV